MIIIADGMTTCALVSVVGSGETCYMRGIPHGEDDTNVAHAVSERACEENAPDIRYTERVFPQ